MGKTLNKNPINPFRLLKIIMASITSACLSWIPALWNKLAVLGLGEILGRPYRHIPDEVLLQILSKLPAKSVLRCRCVCRRWKALTSTQEFAQLHFPHSVPMVIVVRQREADGEQKEIYLVDTCESTEETATPQSNRCRISVNFVRPVSKSDRQEFSYSSNGLVIFREEFRRSTAGLEHYVLLNPLTRQKVRLITPKGLIYGIFSNPFAKDQHCLLWGGRFQRENGSMPFRIVVLGGGSNSESEQSDESQTSCCWRELYEDDDAPFSYQPRAQTPPVIVDNVLYWMVGNRYAIARQSSPSPLPRTRLAPRCAESIMKLDTKTEKFSVMPHPGPQNQYCKDDPEHSRMHLVEMDDRGFLCLCESSLFEESINIWILRHQDCGNSTRPSWIRWHRVGIDLDVDRFPFTTSRSNHNVQPVVIVGKELLLEWPNRGLFGLNLENGSVRIFDRKLEYRTNASMYAHTPSFVPISNCEPEILMST